MTAPILSLPQHDPDDLDALQTAPYVCHLTLMTKTKYPLVDDYSQVLNTPFSSVPQVLQRIRL